ncbi:Protein-tyrosine phosphatase [Cooperia oncophora]
MLEAIDIVLISIGTILSLLASLAILLLFIVKRRKLQGKTYDSSPKVAVAKEYYIERPPTISAAVKNGTAPHFVSKPAAANLLVRVDENAGKKSPINESNGTVILKVDEIAEAKDHDEAHRGSNSIKRSHRPCKIKLSPDLAKAAHAEAVQTEHTLDNFLEDLSRIRNGDDAVIYEEFQHGIRPAERDCLTAEKGANTNHIVRHLRGYRNAGQFIATQGPIGPEETGDGRKESTVDDFWRMIWEKNVQCILMLTDCVENMRQRCTKYWPPLGEAHQYGDVEVDLISESEDPICLHREFDIKRKGEKRQVSQYHFLNWRDSKGPESTTHLLDFIERVWNKQFRKPIVVHCRTVVFNMEHFECYIRKEPSNGC